MKIEALHVGMEVKHPHHGTGTVRTISERTAEIEFNEGRRTIAPETSDIEPAQAQVTISGLELPLTQFVDQLVEKTVEKMGVEKPETSIEELGSRWNKGHMTLHPGDPNLQTKEVPIETFFHKIVMMRNNLRVLEQKLNGHPNLNDGEKVELQQYISRCYGSMTSFNVLFRHKEDQFTTKS